MVEPSPTPQPATAPHGFSQPSRGPTRPKKLWPLISLAVAAVVIGLPLVLWLLFGGSGRPVSSGELTYRVVCGPLTISFSERGTIKALKSEQVFSRLEGMSTIIYVVPEGTFVKKGDLLVEMDSSELTQLLNQQTITVDTAQATLISANEQVEIQKSQNESDLEAAKLTLELAGLDFNKYMKGDREIAFTKATADINIGNKELDRATNKFEWTQKLLAKGYVTKSESDTDQIALLKAGIQKEQAIKAMEALEKYTSVKEERKAKSDVEQAERALKRVALKTNALMAQVLADQKAKQSTYNLSLRRLKKIQDQLEKTKLVAPQDGMVVYFQEGRYGRDDRMIEQGSTVKENQHLIDLPDLSVKAVDLRIPEARIHQVKVGLPATITMESQTELILRGSLTKIGLLPDYLNRWLNPDLKVYQTDITIDPNQDTQLLRPGMSAKVEILVAELDETTIFVPIQAVTTTDGQTVCYVREGNDFKERNVETGLSNNSFIVIVKGLSEGDVIQLNAPKPKGTPPAQKREKEDRSGRPELTTGPDGMPLPAAWMEKEGGPGGPAEPNSKRRGPSGPGDPEVAGEGKDRNGAVGADGIEAPKKFGGKGRKGFKRPRPDESVDEGAGVEAVNGTKDAGKDGEKRSGAGSGAPERQPGEKPATAAPPAALPAAATAAVPGAPTASRSALSQ